MSDEIRPDWRAVVMNETGHLTPGVELPEGMIGCEMVYVFNRAEHTYCCELTPSYWLTPAEGRPIMREDATPEQWERAGEWLMDADAENDGMYMHCRTVDRLPSVAIPDCESEDEARERVYTGGISI